MTYMKNKRMSYVCRNNAVEQQYASRFSQKSLRAADQKQH